MAIRYGTTAGVIDKCRLFEQDISQNNPDDITAIENALDQASDIIRDLLQTRYSISTIDANVPNAVTQLSETVAAIFMAHRMGLTTNANMEEYLKRLEMQKDHYTNLILRGNILDSTSTPLETNPTVTTYSVASNSDLVELYE
jgi:hypothetical protein